MKILKHPLFIIAVLLFLLNQVLERTGVFLPYVHSYLDDLLCMPVTLTMALFLQQKFMRSPDYVFSKNHVAVVVIFYAIFFEVWLPEHSAHYTSDPLDAIAYAAGGLVFYFFINNNFKVSDLPGLNQNKSSAVTVYE
jgi:hypothetical protein